MKKTATELTLGSRRRQALPDHAPGGALRWHHTEFGRRTDCERFRLVYRDRGGWQLLDADWNILADPTDMLTAMQLAERLAKRTR